MVDFRRKFRGDLTLGDGVLDTADRRGQVRTRAPIASQPQITQAAIPASTPRGVAAAKPTPTGPAVTRAAVTPGAPNLTPRGPGNNAPGLSLSTSTTAGRKSGLGRLGLNQDSVVQLLGGFAQAFDPEGPGGRLGAQAVAAQREQKTGNALAKALAGDDLQAEDLTGLDPETRALILQQKFARDSFNAQNENEQRRLALAEGDQKIQQIATVKDILAGINPKDQPAFLGALGLPTNFQYDPTAQQFRLLQGQSVLQQQLLERQAYLDRYNEFFKNSQLTKRSLAEINARGNIEKELEGMRNTVAREGIAAGKFNAIVASAHDFAQSLLGEDGLQRVGPQGSLALARLGAIAFGVDPGAGVEAANSDLELLQDLVPEAGGSQGSAPAPGDTAANQEPSLLRDEFYKGLRDQFLENNPEMTEEDALAFLVHTWVFESQYERDALARRRGVEIAPVKRPVKDKTASDDKPLIP